MLKKMAMLLLCLSLCTVTAFAAYGSVMCDLQNESSTIDDSVSQDTSATQFVSLGGRTTYSDKTEPSAEAKMTLGENKGNNMISVMQNAFGIDLTEYQFVSFGDLWDNAAETTYPALRAIAIDRYVEVEQGQRLPLGFLYQGTTAYTVVEQPNGSLEMIKYELLGTDQVQAGEDRVAEQDDMQYKVLETENKMAPQSVVETLYF